MDAEIDAVRVAGTPDGPIPVVILAPDAETETVLPIFIGFDEAVSIARGLDAMDIGRPLTHDLVLDVIEELGGRVDKIIVSDIEDNTYIAELHLHTPMGTEVIVDARPSDSLALAVRTNAPVEIDEELFDSCQQERDEFDELQDIREVIELS